MVADFILGLDQRKGVAWGLFGACVLMTRVFALRDLGGFDPEFRRCAEWDLAIRGALRGAHFIAVDQPLIMQCKGAKKTGSLPLEFALRLREKHKEYLSARGLYWASRAIARAKFHGGRGRVWKSRAYLSIACLLSSNLLREEFAIKLARLRGVDFR
jgi:hypothetical protein